MQPGMGAPHTFGMMWPHCSLRHSLPCSLPPHLLTIQTPGGLCPKSQVSMFSEPPLLIRPSLLCAFAQPTYPPSMPSSPLSPTKPHLSMTVTDGPSGKLSHPLSPRVPLSPALWRHLAQPAPWDSGQTTLCVLVECCLSFGGLCFLICDWGRPALRTVLRACSPAPSAWCAHLPLCSLVPLQRCFC